MGERPDQGWGGEMAAGRVVRGPGRAGIAVGAAERVQILAERDPRQLDRWLAGADTGRLTRGRGAAILRVI